ncbi:hypothetical protein PG913_12760 [Tenacibaculum pacificus]|uniref:hypothetical protein n=1 Tax=Tenacibaculum TaxID=104267 RepID=UPI0022F3B16D|nr:hypothetical protein [Tenacibaculum pacificus]WBX73676.1 hypothetical protein PG913_12760 [Tenacibaculum pacificus]
MKQKLIIYLFLISSFIAKGQTSNIVTATEFDAFKINNITLSDLKNTQGKKSLIENLLGTVNSYKSDEGYVYITFKGLKVDFSLANNKPYIESFEVNTKEHNITVKNTTVNIGSNISELGTIVFSTGRNGNKSILYTTCEDCDSFINIEFNQKTNIITKISYLDMS